MAAAAVVVVKARAWATALMARVAWRVRSIAEVVEERAGGVVVGWLEYGQADPGEPAGSGGAARENGEGSEASRESTQLRTGQQSSG